MTLTLSLNQKASRTLERQVSTRPRPQVGGPGVYKVPRPTPKIPTSGVFSLKEAIGSYYTEHSENKSEHTHIRLGMDQSLVSTR